VGCSNAYIESAPPAGSDKLAVWVKEAIEKQTLLAGLPADDRLCSVDDKTRDLATQVVVRPTQVTELAASRARVRQLLTNLSRSVSSSVVGELIKTAYGVAADQAQLTLEREARNFHDEMEKLAVKLAEVAGGARRPFRGETRAGVLAELDVARRAAEEKRNKLHDRLVSLGSVVESLGGRPKPIPSPLTLPEAERLANVESENARRLLEEAWQEVTRRLERLGLDVALAGRPESYTKEEDLVCLKSARDWCGLVEEQAHALGTMGLSLSPLAGGTRETILQNFHSAVASGKKDLGDLNERVRRGHLRLERMGSPAAATEDAEFATVEEARTALARLRAEADKVRGQLLSEASASAQRVYHALLSGEEHQDAATAPLVELRRLGLLRTIEDDL
jgi:hypothetical protein